MKTLIIEDDPDIAEVISLCFQLRWPEATLLSASHGLVGVDLAETENPDMVILDLGLPDIDGFEVCRRIRLFSNVPVIMLTAKDMEVEDIERLKSASNGYLAKPFSYSELITRVREMLSHPAIEAKIKVSENPV